MQRILFQAHRTAGSMRPTCYLRAIFHYTSPGCLNSKQNSTSVTRQFCKPNLAGKVSVDPLWLMWVLKPHPSNWSITFVLELEPAQEGRLVQIRLLLFIGFGKDRRSRLCAIVVHERRAAHAAGKI